MQVSRWDRLKDMAGVLTGFVKMAADGPPDAHLMLVGPDVSGVTDDPEGSEVLADCRALWQSVPESIRNRVHLASIPMDDVDENAIIVNAVQRHAYLVVQKSLVEGFGLTVTEAMWKTKPVIASGVGGINDQIVNERDGLLITDPADLDALAAAMTRLLDDHELADRLGVAGHARVVDQFLGDRHLAQYVELFTLASMRSGPKPHTRVRVHENQADDYTTAAAQVRRDFLRDATGATMDDVGRFTLDPATLPGNIENFIGVGAGPDGRRRPTARRRRTRARRLLHPARHDRGHVGRELQPRDAALTECGGVTTTVVDDRMQRAPVFILDDALRSAGLRRVARRALHRDRGGGRIHDDHRQADRDRAVLGRSAALPPFELHDRGCRRAEPDRQGDLGRVRVDPGELSRPATIHPVRVHRHRQEALADQHAATRGKRVVAEAVIDQTVIEDLMGVDTKTLMWGRQISQAGNFMAASANNGAHAANGLAAMFIATGQDVANIADRMPASSYTQLLDNGDYYWSITLPALIVATYGGGTGLATERECLDLLDCYGTGKVRKFAEICAAVVLAGDISLSSAVLHGDWVTSHDRLGRNRP